MVFLSAKRTVMDFTRYWYEVVRACFARGWMNTHPTKQDSRYVWLNPPSPEVGLLQDGFFGRSE